MKISNVKGIVSFHRGPNGLPVLKENSIPRPSGRPGNLKILDWAGCKAAVSYTFDDTQLSQVEHYKELKSLDVALTFYASEGWKTYPNYDEAWSLMVKDGHEIGSHTVNHANGNLLKPITGNVLKSQNKEIDENMKYIKEHLGQKAVYTFAAPYGDPDWRKYAMNKFFINRGISDGIIAPNSNVDPFNLPVMRARGGESTEIFNKSLEAARRCGSWIIYLYHTILPSTSNWYAGVDISNITGTINYAKSLKNIWIDTVTNIGAYWIGQKTLSTATYTISDTDTLWKWSLPRNFPPGRYVRVTVDGGILSQNGKELAWDEHGYYEVALDNGELTLSE